MKEGTNRDNVDAFDILSFAVTYSVLRSQDTCICDPGITWEPPRELDCGA